MPIFEISYSYDIKDKKTEEVVFWKRSGFTVEVNNVSDIDTSLIKEKIRQLAKEHCTSSTHYIAYANYYAITMIEGNKKGK